VEHDDPKLLVRDDGSSGYVVRIPADRPGLRRQLDDLKALVEAGRIRDVEFHGVHVIPFAEHLYEPLLSVTSDVIEVSPTSLNSGEVDFVEHMRRFHSAHPQAFRGRKLRVVRNLSRGKGLGFFEAGNFYPDFIVWLTTPTTQRIVFVDPKGLRQLDADDEKIMFSRTIKNLERRLGDPHVQLDSFIVSSTSASQMSARWNLSKDEMRQRNILFAEDGEAYIAAIIG
jgi:hypothetical protein